jgi:hypothetical protein
VLDGAKTGAGRVLSAKILEEILKKAQKVRQGKCRGGSLING